MLVIGNIIDSFLLKNGFKTFYSIQTILSLFGLIRTTCFGFILHKLEVSPFYLSLFFIIGMLSSVVSYFLFPFFCKKFNNYNEVIRSFELISLFSNILFFSYCVYCFYLNDWGNFWVWSIISLLSLTQVFGNNSSRPLFVKESFVNQKLQNIIRLDLLSLSFSKFIGYLIGYYIISIYMVIVISFLSLIVNVISYSFYIQIGKINKANNIVSNSDNEEDTKNNSNLNNDSHHKFSTIITYLIVFLASFFLTFINVQAVFFQSVFNIPFYVIPFIGGTGALFWNLFFTKNIKLFINGKFIFHCLLISISFMLMLFSQSQAAIIIGAFICGGCYTFFINLATSRIFTSSKTNHPKAISTFYMLVTLISVIGVIISGLLFEFLLFQYAMIVIVLTMFVFFLIILFMNNKIKQNKLF